MKLSSTSNAHRALTLIIILLSAGLTLLLYYLLYRHAAGAMDAFTFSTFYDYARPVIMFIVMLFGMFFNQLFESLQRQKSKGKTTVSIGETLKEGILGINFWMAVFVSPIVFFATYYLVSSIPDDRIAWFYAFQNGFFWHYVFNKFELRAKADEKKAAVLP